MSQNRALPLIAAAVLCSASAWSAELPEGKGKEIVQGMCNTCHPFFARVGGGYTPEGWNTVLRMMTNQGLALTPDQMTTVKAYLVKNFPEKPKPAGVVIAGPYRVSMKAWQVPTPGSRPHDPLAARDGSLWYTGQMANVLGRLDPKTGTFKEYPLKTPHSAPHGLMEDREGNIWYTGNAAGLVGKLDPKTGNVTEYRCPIPPCTIRTPWFSIRAAFCGSRRKGRIASAGWIRRQARSSCSRRRRRTRVRTAWP